MFKKINQSLSDKLNEIIGDSLGVKDENDSVKPTEAQKRENPINSLVSIPGNILRFSVENCNVLLETINVINN